MPIASRSNNVSLSARFWRMTGWNAIIVFRAQRETYQRKTVQHFIKTKLKLHLVLLLAGMSFSIPAQAPNSASQTRRGMTMKQILLITLALAALASTRTAFTQSGAEAWVQRYNASTASDDRVSKLVVDFGGRCHRGRFQ